MPLVRIDVVKGRSERELADLLAALHEAMVEAFGVPVGDRYQVLTEHEPGRMLLEDTGLGFTRSDSRVLIQIFTRPRSSQKKQDFYRLAVQYLADRLGIAGQDIMLTCVDNADVDWSFAHGRAQFMTGEL